MGLGNILFQIASAIYYCEKYNYEIILNYSNSIVFGTSNMFGKTKCLKDENNNYLSYDKTIFKKFKFMNSNNAYKTIIYNNFSDTRLVEPNSDILVRGYNQNINLFKEYINLIPNYLHLKDTTITNYIYNKYGDVSNELIYEMKTKLLTVISHS